MRWALYRWLFQFAKRCQHQTMVAGGHHLKGILNDSRQAYGELLNDSNLKAQWQQSGLLYVMQSEHGVAEFLATDTLLNEHYGLKAKFINGKDLTAFDPALKSGLAGGFLYQNDASLEPHVLVQNWAQNLKHMGVKFITPCQLLHINSGRQKINSILTSEGEMCADHYVFATGAWSSKLASELACDIPVEPCKGYSVTVDRPEVCPQVPMLFHEHGVGATPFENSFRLGSMIEFSGFDSRINPSRIKQLYQSAAPYLKSTLNHQGEQPWCGWRPMTWDSLPIIGHVPQFRNAILATGHNMLGMTLAPATGKMVADLLAGDTPAVDPKPFAPDRF